MNYSTMLLHAVLEEDEKYVRVAGADSGFLSRELRRRIEKYLEEREDDRPVTFSSHAKQVFREVKALNNPVTATPTDHKYEAVLGFMGLVECPECKGTGTLTSSPAFSPAGSYSCMACISQGRSTGKVPRQFTLEELHKELNEISLKHSREGLGLGSDE
jgi:hypothetical protein